MKFFQYSTRQSSSRKNRPLNVQPLITRLESRQLMSMSVPPDFGVPVALGASHVGAVSFDSAMISEGRPAPAFGQMGLPNTPAFDANVNAFNVPTGLIGENLVHAGPTIDAGEISLSTSVTGNAAMPAIAVSVVGTTDASIATNNSATATPGTGLLYQVHQAALADSIAAVASTDPGNAFTALNEFTNGTALTTSSAFHAQASAIAQNIAGLVSVFGSGLNTSFDAVVQDLPASPVETDTLSTIAPPSALSIDGPATPVFANGAAAVEDLAKSVGDAFLRSLMMDLAQFETGVDSAVNQIGSSLHDWRAAAVAGAVVAVGTYLQRNAEDDEEKRAAGLWIPRR